MPLSPKALSAHGARFICNRFGTDLPTLAVAPSVEVPANSLLLNSVLLEYHPLESTVTLLCTSRQGLRYITLSHLQQSQRRPDSCLSTGVAANLFQRQSLLSYFNAEITRSAICSCPHFRGWSFSAQSAYCTTKLSVLSGFKRRSPM